MTQAAHLKYSMCRCVCVCVLERSCQAIESRLYPTLTLPPSPPLYTSQRNATSNHHISFVPIKHTHRLKHTHSLSLLDYNTSNNARLSKYIMLVGLHVCTAVYICVGGCSCSSVHMYVGKESLNCLHKAFHIRLMKDIL